MTDDRQVAREISWLSTVVLMIATYAFALASVVAAEVSTGAADVGSAVTVGTAVLAIIQTVDHLITYNDLVRRAAATVLPRRWLGMEVDR